MQDASGRVFECLDREETEFLWEEIFVRRSYVQCGICVPQRGRPLIVDAGANIGLFSLFALSENDQASVIAIEPAPAAFDTLERNLSFYKEARCLPILLSDRGSTADP